MSLKKAKPVYTVLPGWKSNIRGITRYEDLPENCRRYIEFIEKELEVPVTMVSTDLDGMKLFTARAVWKNKYKSDFIGHENHKEVFVSVLFFHGFYRK